jgi:aminoglycoside phosphotransferase
LSLISEIFDSATVAHLLRGQLGAGELHPVAAGASGDGLFRYVRPGQPACYVRVAPWTCPELHNAKAMYDFLAGKVWVPQVLYFGQVGRLGVLVLTELVGTPLAELVGQIDDHELVICYARALRQLHSVAIGNHDLGPSLAQRLARARERVEQGLLVAADLEDEYQGQSPTELYAQLRGMVPNAPGRVLAHGDFCLDNLIMGDQGQVGYLDLGRGGVADPYLDLALALRGLRHELGHNWADLFCLEYGIAQLDPPKVAFYTLLDEFF